jgi:hypothetical protein
MLVLLIPGLRLCATVLSLLGTSGFGFVWRIFIFRGGFVRRRPDFTLRFYGCSCDQFNARFGSIDRSAQSDRIGYGKSRFFAGKAQFSAAQLQRSVQSPAARHLVPPQLFARHAIVKRQTIGFERLDLVVAPKVFLEPGGQAASRVGREHCACFDRVFRHECR